MVKPVSKVDAVLMGQIQKARLYLQGECEDAAALEVLINLHWRILRSLAWKSAWASTILDVDDLTQEAVIGLFKAILAYDPQQGSLANLVHYKARGEISNALKASRWQRHDSLDVPMADTVGNENLWVDLLEDPFTWESVDTRLFLETALRLLSLEERSVIELHYGLLGTKETYEMVGQRFGRDRHWSFKINKKALEKLRHATGNS